MPRQRKILSEEERRRRVLQLAKELQARGIPVSQVLRQKERENWRQDERGYFLRYDGKRYNPTEGQENFIQSEARFCAFIGSRGSGKTSASAQKALRRIKRGLSGAVLNPEWENFKVSTWPEFRDWIPWDMVVDSQRYRSSPTWQPNAPFTLVFKNGARVICKGLKNPNSARGPNINWLWFDEAQEDRDGLAWRLAVASVRVGDKPQAWVSATPAGIDHWMYEFFVARNIPEDVARIFAASDDRPLVEWFHGTIEENKDNLDPGFYAAMLAAYPTGWLREQEIEGKFVSHGSALGDPSWFDGNLVPAAPAHVRSKVRYWDLAATEKKIVRGRLMNDPDETVGTLMSWDGDCFYIEEQVGGWYVWKDLKALLVEVAKRDGPYVPIYVEQEPGAGGKNQVAEIVDYIQHVLGPSYRVYGHRPEGDKVMRANVWFAEAAEGKVKLVRGEWNKPFLEQLSVFPIGRHDDRIDSVSGARHCLAPIRQWRKIEFLHV